MFTRFSVKKSIIVPLILLLSGLVIFAQAQEEQYEDYSTLIERLMKEQEARDNAQNEQKEDTYLEETLKEEVQVQEQEPEPGVQETEPELEPEPAPEPEPVAQDVEPSEVQESEEPAATEENTATEETAAEEPTEEKHKYEALAMIRYKNTDTVNFKLKFSYIPKPYILGISLAAGYSAYKLIQPFYFGGYLEPHIGIPQKKFPFRYELDGEAIGGPLIMGGKLYAPFGICVFPFQRNIEVFIEFEPGITFDFLWNGKFGKKSITSKLYPAFYAAIRTGAAYKNITVFAEGNYDAILGFGVSIGVGYNLNIQYTTRADQTNSLEDEASQ